MTGTIPDVFTDTSPLRVFTALSAGLLGPIPETLTLCKDLEILDLGYNYLSGSIPADLGASRYLRYAYLMSNNLTGGFMQGCFLGFEVDSATTPAAQFLVVHCEHLKWPLDALCRAQEPSHESVGDPESSPKSQSSWWRWWHTGMAPSWSHRRSSRPGIAGCVEHPDDYTSKRHTRVNTVQPDFVSAGLVLEALALHEALELLGVSEKRVSKP